MKNTYYLSVDVISNHKTTQEELDSICRSIELSCKGEDVLEVILENISLNFQGFVTVNIESEEFQNNFSDQLGEIIDSLEKEFPGGCTTDSRIEWESDRESYNLLWFKNKEKWSCEEIENQERDFGYDDWDGDEQDDDDRPSYW